MHHIIESFRGVLRSPVLQLLLRGSALFVGSFLLLGWVMYWSGPQRYDATVWWVDLRILPGPLPMVMSLAFGWALLHRALIVSPGRAVMRLRTVLLWCLVAVLLMNSATAWRLHAVGSSAHAQAGVRLGVLLPLTALLALIVWMMLLRTKDVEPARRAGRFVDVLRVGFAAGCIALLAALAQMFWFGESDYRRPADAILVYGCRAYTDGTPSQALADRVHTACELYHQGLAQRIVMSGGPVRNSSLHETQVMADYAVSLGVPREAILLDPNGLDTQATAENLEAILHVAVPNKSPRLLAVSHDYHLPRVKLSLERQGLTAYTVPAEIRRGLPSKPYLMARETAAWWYYYFSPVIACF